MAYKNTRISVFFTILCAAVILLVSVKVMKKSPRRPNLFGYVHWTTPIPKTASPIKRNRKDFGSPTSLLSNRLQIKGAYG